MSNTTFLFHFASFGRATTGESEAVFGEDSVAEVEDVGDDWQTSRPDKPSESHRGVELAKDFNANDPFSWVAVFVRQSAMDFVHEVGGGFAELRRPEVRCGNVSETNALSAIEPLEELDLAHAQWALSVEEDFDAPVVEFCWCVHVLLQPNKDFVATKYTGRKRRVVRCGFHAAVFTRVVGSQFSRFHPGSQFRFGFLSQLGIHPPGET